MPIASLSRHAPGLFTPALELYHLLPLHMPLTLFLLDAPFGRFAPKGKKWVVNGTQPGSVGTQELTPSREHLLVLYGDCSGRSDGDIQTASVTDGQPSVLLWTLGSIPVQLSTNSAVLAVSAHLMIVTKAHRGCTSRTTFTGRSCHRWYCRLREATCTSSSRSSLLCTMSCKAE
jgi:hypothetical protein